jgi:hypothetical protein
VFAGFKAARSATNAAHFAKMTARGEVVQQVATAPIFMPLPPPAKWTMPKRSSRRTRCSSITLTGAPEAGTVANLDELRARVQLQTQQQIRIAAENALEKDLILLKREIGIDPGQKSC